MARRRRRGEEVHRPDIITLAVLTLETVVPDQARVTQEVMVGVEVEVEAEEEALLRIDYRVHTARTLTFHHRYPMSTHRHLIGPDRKTPINVTTEETLYHHSTTGLFLFPRTPIIPATTLSGASFTAPYLVESAAD